VEGLSHLGIKDGAKAKSKNLDVVAEFGKSHSKNTANFVVIGERH
jgi:elongation factor 1 alpha-like protein